MEHFKQYNEIGKAYISAQEKFFADNDWSRKLILDRVGDVTGKVVVDAGCGHGVETRLLLESNPQKIIAFDPSSVMLEEAHSRTQDENVVFVEGDFSHIPAEDVSTDVLVSCFSLHYMQDIDQAYQEIYRILKPLGRAVIVVPHPEDSHARKLKQGTEGLVKVPIYSDEVTVSYPVHTMEEYFSKFQKGHFDVLDLEELVMNEVSPDYPAILAFTLVKKEVSE